VNDAPQPLFRLPATTRVVAIGRPLFAPEAPLHADTSAPTPGIWAEPAPAAI